MGNEMTDSAPIRAEHRPLAARASGDDYDGAAIGMESAFPALQTQHWHSAKQQTVNDQEAQ